LHASCDRSRAISMESMVLLPAGATLLITRWRLHVQTDLGLHSDLDWESALATRWHVLQWCFLCSKLSFFSSFSTVFQSGQTNKPPTTPFLIFIISRTTWSFHYTLLIIAIYNSTKHSAYPRSSPSPPHPCRRSSSSSSTPRKHNAADPCLFLRMQTHSITRLSCLLSPPDQRPWSCIACASCRGFEAFEF
jgi:hypothetical protein